MPWPAPHSTKLDLQSARVAVQVGGAVGVDGKLFWSGRCVRRSIAAVSWAVVVAGWRVAAKAVELVVGTWAPPPEKRPRVDLPFVSLLENNPSL